MTVENQFKPGNQASKGKGKPKGPTMKTMFEKRLNAMLTRKNDKTGKAIKKTVREWLVEQRIADALDPRNSANERVKAGESIENRVEGKPVQPLSSYTEAEVNLTISPDEAEV